MRISIALAAAMMLTSCASGYENFYKPVGDPAAINAMRVAPPPQEPLVQRSPPGDNTAIEASFARKSYFVIGFSSFNGGAGESEKGAIAMGKKVGADLVLILNPQYTGTKSGVVPITMPTSSTTYSTGQATAYGPGGTVSAYGSGTSTTYGSKTDYIPYSVDRMDYTAVYFVKQKLRIGLFTKDLTDDERQAIGSNKGASIRLVVDESPAYEADLLVGDIITAVDGKSVAGADGFSTITKQIPPGRQQVDVAILRGGNVFTKKLSLY